ncbi:MAG: TlpA family protein disulfide reductase [Desulfobacterales bacterium]|nr:TlpA family protein disulfide reductase [Desulfobacterales bacterium]
MKKTLFLSLILSLLLLAGGCGSSSQIPQVGDAAPDFTLVDRQGKSWTLSQLRGQVVFVNFWATWCPPCQKELPSMERLHAQMPGEGFKMLALLSNDKPELADFVVEQKKLTFPVLPDDEGLAGLAYGVTGLPETFIIDKQGVIRHKVLGGAEWDDPDTVAFIAELVRE